MVAESGGVTGTAQQTQRFIDAAKYLLRGCDKLALLRKEFPGALRLAVDNDVVMDYVSPHTELSQKLSDAIVPLLKNEGGARAEFSVADQAVSLADRLSRFILYDAARNDHDRQVYSLPGHHSELWDRQAASILQRLSKEVNPSGLTPELAEEIKDFKTRFYEPVTRGDLATNADLVAELLAAVPGQLRGWLGIGTTAQEWDRLQRVRRDKVLAAFPDQAVERRHLGEAAQRTFQEEMKAATEKWRERLAAAYAAYAAAYAAKTRRTRRRNTPWEDERIRSDAVAMAYWERLNRDTYRPRGERLVLVTASARIEAALKQATAEELGWDADEPVDKYLLHLFDFLDECHVHLTGKLESRSDGDMSGRLGVALRMVAEANANQTSPQTVKEFTLFGEIWARFLRVCVLERVQNQRQQHSTHLRRVLFVFSRAGISLEESAGNPLVVMLASRGSEMLRGATDVRLRTMPLASFTRGAPVLRLAKHSEAEKLQLLKRNDFREAIIDRATQRTLFEEEGRHRYTLHLHQARAFIWAADWKTALSLCNFCVAISSKLPPREDGRVSDIDGREAMFLAAVCERHAGGGTRRALREALGRLRKFEALAESGVEGTAHPDRELELHRQRSASERLAIQVTEALMRLFGLRKPDVVDEPEAALDTLDIADLLRSLAATRANARAKGAAPGSAYDERMRAFIYMLIEQQCWVQETQLRLLFPRADTETSVDILLALGEAATDLRARRNNSLASYDVLPSPFMEQVERLVDCVTGRATDEVRAAIRRTLQTQRTSVDGLFHLEETRRQRFVALTLATPDEAATGR